MGLQFVEKGSKVVSKSTYDKLASEYEALLITLKGLETAIDHVNQTKENNPFKDALFVVAADESKSAVRRAEKVGKLIKGL